LPRSRVTTFPHAGAFSIVATGRVTAVVRQVHMTMTCRSRNAAAPLTALDCARTQGLVFSEERHRHPTLGQQRLHRTTRNGP
jgi:hypothetical protein